MPTAIHYSSVTRPDNAQEIFGLQVAVVNWLKAYLRYSRQERFFFLVSDAIARDEIYKIAGSVGISPERIDILDRRYARENFGRFDTIFRIDSDPHQLFWQRQQLDNPSYNVCTLAHAISGLEAGQVLERYCLDPSEITDTIVCPSHAVAKAIRCFWDNYGVYIERRFGRAFHCPVQLPVIPFGVDIDHFRRITSAEKRAVQRQKLGIADEDIVLLWVGRLSHAIKAHPLAMFQAAERAAAKTDARIHLVMQGYFVPHEAETEFRQLASAISDKTRISFVANNDERFQDGLWAAGDIFLSLIDNMQESFGLTPIEAMAAGLPRVISDWNGYRDSVMQGEDGFLIRTLQPPAGAGRALVDLLLSSRDLYGGYLAKTAQCVAVDQDMAAEVIALLIRDKNRRKSIAEKALRKVEAVYDWKTIIPAYEALWEKQVKERRNLPDRTVPWPSVLPQAPDPFQMYSGYPSAALHPLGILKIAASIKQIEALWQHNINIMALDIMLPPEKTMRFIQYISDQGSASVQDLLATVTEPEIPAAWRTIAWLIKLGILAYSEN